MGFPRQEFWSGLPRPPAGDLPDPGIEPRSLTSKVDFLPSEPPGEAMEEGKTQNSISGAKAHFL